MHVAKIQQLRFEPLKYVHKNTLNKNINTNNSNNYNETLFFPYNNAYCTNINFKADAYASKRRIVNVPLINFEDYNLMSNARKERLRMLYRSFHEILSETQMQTLLKIDPHPEFMQLPLQTEKEMDEFINVAKMYSRYKENPIICLGRSPKWFLNASLWMKDGIPDYKYIAFSGMWYRIYDGDFGDNRGLVRIDAQAPTKLEEKGYKKYLKNIQADPLSIIKKTQETGEKAIITDYIDTGKGVTSFLDFMSRYADEQGVLDEFGHSFNLVTIGCNEYRQKRRKQEYLTDPEVWMPPLLEKYVRPTTPWGSGKIIDHYYYDMDYDVFEQMLYNQNTNECRSTYYPHSAWTIYKPNKFKTGMVKDMKKIKDLLSRLHSERPIFNYEPIMSAYRNLLNFRILDGLKQRDLLKTMHCTKL